MTFASRMQHKIYWGPLKKPIEWSLKTILAPWAYIASVLYHDLFWYPTHQGRIREILKSDWGRLFHNWEKKALPPDDLSIPGWTDVGAEPAKLDRQTSHLMGKALRVLGTCVKEAPEFDAKRRRQAPP
jgi:hypothetical protein